MKKILIFFIMSILCCITVNAASDMIVDIKHNGEYIEYETKGILINNSVFVPVRYASVALGIERVEWEENEKKITLASDDNILELFAGRDYAYINGIYESINVPPVIVNSRTYIPVRYIAEAFGSNIEWNSEIYAVNIINELTPDGNYKNYYYNDIDIYWLSRIIEAESSGEPMAGKIAVGNVVLNRRASKDFPNSVYEVVFQNNGVTYQFTPVANNKIYNIPSFDSLAAAKLALNNTNTAGESLFFLNPAIAQSNWIINNRVYYLTINNHDFYL